MLNQVQIIGNLGADPESRSFNNGGKVVNMRLAATEKWKDKSGERKERTEWVSVAIFNEGLAGVAEQYLRKGSKVFVQGKLQTRKWQDQNGQDRYSTEVVLQGFDAKLVMLDGANGDRTADTGGAASRGRDDFGGGNFGGGGSGGFGSSPSRGSFSDDLDDDVPF